MRGGYRVPPVPAGHHQQGEGGDREHEVPSQQQPVRVEAEQEGGDHQKCLAGVNRHHGLPVMQPEGHEVVMDVVLVRGEGGPALHHADGHHRQRVQDRDPQEEEGEDGAYRRVPLRESERKGHRRKSEQLAPRVPHEHRGGVGVVAQEAEDRAGHRQADKPYEKVSFQVGEVPDAAEDEQADAAGQAVQAVREVDGVGHSHDRQDGQREGDPAGQVVLPRKEHPQRVDLDLPEDDNDKGRKELPEELPFRADIPAIVDDAETNHDRRAGQPGPDEMFAARPEKHGEERPRRHRDPADPGDGPLVDLPFAREVHHMEPFRHGAQRRNQGDGRQKGHEQCVEEDQRYPAPGRNVSRTGTICRVNS